MYGRSQFFGNPHGIAISRCSFSRVCTFDIRCLGGAIPACTMEPPSHKTDSKSCRFQSGGNTGRPHHTLRATQGTCVEFNPADRMDDVLIDGLVRSCPVFWILSFAMDGPTKPHTSSQPTNRQPISCRWAPKMAPPKSARDWWKAGNERGRHMGAREGSRGEKGREERACEPSILTRKKGGFATAQAGECRRLHQSTCVECDGP